MPPYCGGTVAYGQNNKIDLVRYLLNYDGIETASMLLPLDDGMAKLFVRAGYDIFNRKLGAPEGNFKNCLVLHQGKSWFGVGGAESSFLLYVAI